MPVVIDHVVWGEGDLGKAAADLQDRYGLPSLAGGHHPGWGTENRIVPLGPNYLELLAIADEAEASQDDTGALWLRRIREGGGLLTWCLSTDDIDKVSVRLGLDIRHKWRIRPDGSELSWRIAGLEAALERPGFPFFISWEVPPDLHPGRMGTRAPDAHGISWVQVGVDPAELSDWLGGEEVPVRFGGLPRVNAVGIEVGGRELVIP